MLRWGILLIWLVAAAGFASPGQVDRTFHPAGIYKNESIVTVVEQERKLLVAGSNGLVRRLRPDGGLDRTFRMRSHYLGVNLLGVSQIRVRADGRIGIGFPNHVALLLPNGRIDPSYVISDGIVRAAIRNDGSVFYQPALLSGRYLQFGFLDPSGRQSGYGPLLYLEDRF